MNYVVKTDITPQERLRFVVGRLDGLSGTTRYDLPEELRMEIKLISSYLTQAIDTLVD